MKKTVFGSWEHRRLPHNNRPALGVLRTQEAWNRPELIQKTIVGFHSGESDDLQYLHLGLGSLLAAQTAPKHSVQWVFPQYQNSFLLGAREDLFWTELREAELGTSVRSAQDRILTGASMGGFVALSLALRHPQQFASAILHAPALLNFDPFEDAPFLEYSKRHHMSPEFAAYLKNFFGQAFKDSDTWKRYDPFSILSGTPIPPAVGDLNWSISVGTEDQLGLLDGCQAWCNQWNQRGLPIKTMVQVPGGKHDPEFLAAQLQHLLQAVQLN